MWPFGKKTVIPAPTGSADIGTTRFDLAAPGDRRIPVQAWYPAQPSGGPREPYLDGVLRAALADLMHVPKLLLPRNPSFSTRDAPAVAGRYPVLVFNHGFGSFQKQTSTLLEELASHGYVVLSVGHPHDSLVVQFTDGSTIRYDPELPAWKATAAGLKAIAQNAQELEPLLGRARKAKTPEDLEEAMRAVAAHRSYAPLLPVLEIWAADTRAVLDALSRLDDGTICPLLRGIVDAKHVGAFGHSLGGILSGQLAMTEPRVGAAMNLDGAQLASGAGRYALEVPVCFLYADTTKLGKTSVTNEGMNDALAVNGPAGSCSAVLVGANHLNFTDMNNLWMAGRMLGAIDRGDMARVLRAVTVGFFDRHLKGAPAAGFEPSATLRVLCAPR
jgi:dienelactone hydrolase